MMMRLADLSPQLRQRVARRRFDRFIEKHEGPWPWEYWLRDDAVEFLRVEGFDVLFPIEKEHHRNVSILRCVASDTRQILTIFLKDTTFDSDISAGRVAICEKMPGESWYLTIFYHEWYITDNS
jgi:hypothetical protein